MINPLKKLKEFVCYCFYNPNQPCDKTDCDWHGACQCRYEAQLREQRREDSIWLLIALSAAAVLIYCLLAI